ncbi:hypothetical protein PG988_004597 [Apiospora saccharicola]
MYPDGETAFDKEKRRHFRSSYNLSDMRKTEGFIGRLDKPFWMRSLRTWLSFLMVPSTRRVHSTEDLLRAEANPIEPEKCLFKNLIRATAPVPVDYITADVGQLNWADVMCWQQDFLRQGEQRQLASLALFHGHFEEYSKEALAKEGEWTPLFTDPNDPSIAVPFSFDDLIKHMMDNGSPTTLVVAQYPSHLQGDVFPLHSQHYLEMQEQGRSERPRSEFAVISDDGDDGDDE